jgi:ribonuclease HII
MMRISQDHEKERIHKMLQYEQKLWSQGFRYIAGIDEAGRGPLAGPVVAGAVIFSPDVIIPGMNDSKKLNSKQREALFQEIINHALTYSTGIISEKKIDQINILQATYEAMYKAVNLLAIQPEHLLIDGRRIPENGFHQTAIIKGDQKSFSIAAASIIAKVTRDRIMGKYDKKYSQYGFSRNKGYGTKEHVEAIRKYGLCNIHRKSFHIRGWDL